MPSRRDTSESKRVIIDKYPSLEDVCFCGWTEVNFGASQKW
jgi:hypothetical protein